MKYPRALWVLFFVPLLLLACEDDNTVTPPPPPLSPDEQVVAYCRDLRDALEAYAASHGGTYGEYWIDWRELAIDHTSNPYSGEYEPSGIRATSPGQIGLEEYACDGAVLGYRITGYGRDRMLITLESMENVPADVRYVHDVTIANAFLVMDAAKRFAVSNDGNYPEDLSDTNNDGKSLIELLPSSEFLINPAIGCQCNPVDGAAGSVADIGYTSIDNLGQGISTAFMIDALGCDGTVIVLLLPYTQFGEYVFLDSHNLRLAVEAFAEAAGHYPHNLDTETTPGGKTVLNLFTELDYDHDTILENPFTKEHYYPSIGIATGKGEIAYQPIETAGVVTDFVITGRGVFDEIVRIGPYPTP